MQASLPMYARPELEAAHEALWAGLRDRLRAIGLDAPDALTADGIGYDFWERPDLILSQACGYPYRARLRPRVALVGTPDYGLEDCPPGFYRSRFVVRADAPQTGIADLHGARLAYNEEHSQSGYVGPLAYAASMGVELTSALETGGHRRSVQAVAEGRADVAAIDAVTWRDVVKFDAVASRIKVIADTYAVAGLPLICAAGLPADRIAEVYDRALQDLPPGHHESLGIRRLIRTQPSDYNEHAFRPK